MSPIRIAFIFCFVFSLLNDRQAYGLNLTEICEEFFDVAQLNEIIDVIEQRKLQNDPDIVKISQFLNSSEFQSIRDHMWKNKEFIELYEWFVNNGMSLNKIWFNVTDIFDAENITLESNKSSNVTLFNEIKAIFPSEDIFRWIFNDLLSKTNMYAIFSKLQRSENVWHYLNENAEYRALKCNLVKQTQFKHYEIVESIFCAFLGWKECGEVRKFEC